MGRKARAVRESGINYEKKVDRLFRALGVPNSVDVASVAERRLGADFMDVWNSVDGVTMMGLAMSSLEAAVVMGVGMREELLRQQVPWLCQQIENTQDDGAGVVVDIGSGTGITAACLSRLQGHDALAIDADRASVGIARQLADRIGASVTPECRTLADLRRDQLPSRVKAVIAQALIFYTWGPHDHRVGHSWETAVANRLRDPEGADSEYARLFELAEGATLLLVDFTCPEVTASVVALAARWRLRLRLDQVAQFRGQVGDRLDTQMGLSFVTEQMGARVPSAAELLDAIAPGAMRQEGPALFSTAWSAERGARDLPPAEACWSLSGPHVEQRVAIGSDRSNCYVYRSTDTGDRRLWVYPAARFQEVADGVRLEVALATPEATSIGEWFRPSNTLVSAIRG